MHHHCGPKVLPPCVAPTKCNVTHSTQHFIQPHIFPSHTTHVNQQVIHHQNFYPHTDSFVNEVVNVGPTAGGPVGFPGAGGVTGGVPGAFPGVGGFPGGF